ncbi:MAG TPA: hypothetical protein DDZ22_02935, partial [Massilia sp.]|nr:hypothetical protein [Massilia sp.]
MVDSLFVMMARASAAAALEQGRPQPFFQAAHRLADRGRGHAQFLGRRRKAFVAGTGLEGTQGIQVDERRHGGKVFLSTTDSLSRLSPCGAAATILLIGASPDAAIITNKESTMGKQFEGKKLLVVGGTSGIG